MTSFFSKCPKCGVMMVPGNPCPQCHHSDNPEHAQQHESLVAEYESRQQLHVRNYTLFMVATLGTALGAVGSIACAYLRKGQAIGHAAFGPQEDAPGVPREAMSLLFLLFGFIGIASAAVLFLSKHLFPTALNCPKCEVRVDELGLNDGHCPGCAAKLR